MFSKVASAEVKKIKGKYEWYFSSIRGNNVDTADAITSETAKNSGNDLNLGANKQQTN